MFLIKIANNISKKNLNNNQGTQGSCIREDKNNSLMIFGIGSRIVRSVKQKITSELESI